MSLLSSCALGLALFAFGCGSDDEFKAYPPFERTEDAKTWLTTGSALAVYTNAYEVLGVADGKLTYDDGTPVTGASVVLQTTVKDQPVVARGMATPDGKFELTTFIEGDGVVAGEHQVSISPLPIAEGTKPLGPPIPPQYWDFSTSQLTTSVTPQTTEILITLSRSGKK